MDTVDSGGRIIGAGKWGPKRDHRKPKVGHVALDGHVGRDQHVILLPGEKVVGRGEREGKGRVAREKGVGRRGSQRKQEALH